MPPSSMKRTVAIVVVAAALSGCHQERPQDAVRATIDRRSVFIGDSIRLSLVADVRDDTQVVFPKYAKSGPGVFNVRGSSREMTTRLSGGRMRHAAYYTITTYKHGKVEVPPLEITLIRNGKSEVRKTPPIPVNVNSVIGEQDRPKDIRDIKGPLAYPTSPLAAAAVIMASVAVLAAVAYILSIALKRKKKPEPPREKALREIAEARALIVSGNDRKELYARISWTVRTYIEEMFSIKAPEMTTEEFLSSPAVHSILSDAHRRSLAEFMSACDLVKFADHRPSTADDDAVCSRAASFVTETSSISGQKRGG